MPEITDRQILKLFILLSLFMTDFIQGPHFSGLFKLLQLANGKPVPWKERFFLVR